MLNIKTDSSLNPYSDHLYEHNCSGCKFAGVIEHYDIYLCSETLIARFGNKAHEYWSTDLSCLTPSYFISRDLIGLKIVRTDIIVLLSELEKSGLIKTNYTKEEV